MGTWADGPFDNDDAADFLDEVSDAGSPADALRAALAVPDGTYLEAPQGAVAVAAAALIGYAVGRTSPGGSGPADQLLERSVVPSDAAAVQSARAALDRVIAPESELVELWSEAGELDAFTGQIDAIRERLAKGGA